MPKLWFKRKTYGWGWTPVSWEGWLVTLVYIALLIGIITIVDENAPNKEIFFALLFIAFITISLFRICYAKGEEPRWQWGKKDR